MMASNRVENENVILKNGNKMPVIALGTSRIPPRETVETLSNAIDVGYRHFDTSEFYTNHVEVGECLQKSILTGKVKREELFITGKIAPCYEMCGDIESSINQFLNILKLEYVDMCMLHFPVQFKKGAWKCNDHTKLDAHLNGICNHETVWKELEAVVSKGMAKSLGVSNFNLSQLTNLLHCCKIRPAAVQTEVHAYLQENEMVKLCQQNEIFVMAFAPLGSPGLSKYQPYYKDGEILTDPIVLELAAQYNRSPAQILLRHHIQRGIGVIPKSSNINRMKENLKILDFHLTDSDLVRLSQLNQNRRIFYYPFLRNHPQSPFPACDTKENTRCNRP